MVPLFSKFFSFQINPQLPKPQRPYLWQNPYVLKPPKIAFTAPADTPNYYKLPLNNITNASVELQNFPSSIKAIMSAPYQLAPPQMGPPPDVSPLTLIFIFYHFLKFSFESLNARHHYNFSTQKTAPFSLLCPPNKNFSCFCTGSH